MTWNGRQLSTLGVDGKTVSYTYDADGQRTAKTVGTDQTTYLYIGGQLCKVNSPTAELELFYDDDGRALGFSISSERYGYAKFYYVYNAQGDVVQLRDAANNVTANYLYDAWGKLLHICTYSGQEITDASHAALLNPIRYRGYVYDSETGLYYVSSRYYDPEIGRWINADGFASTGQDITGNNMFAYCGNNPVDRVDPSGMFWKKIGNSIKKVGSAIAGFTKSTFGAGVTTVYQSKQEVELSPPGVNQIVSVKTGKKESITVSSAGNSSKPISVYAQGRSDNLLLSSAGFKINISNFTLMFSLGVENIGFNGSIRKGDTTDSFGLKADLSQIKIGFEKSTTVKWDENTNVTSYANVSFTGLGLVAAYAFVTTGQWLQNQQIACNQ